MIQYSVSNCECTDSLNSSGSKTAPLFPPVWVCAFYVTELSISVGDQTEENGAYSVPGLPYDCRSAWVTRLRQPVSILCVDTRRNKGRIDENLLAWGGRFHCANCRVLVTCRSPLATMCRFRLAVFASSKPAQCLACPAMLKIPSIPSCLATGEMWTFAQTLSLCGFHTLLWADGSKKNCCVVAW